MFKTIKIQEETHSKLKMLGSKSETFDNIIKRLLQQNIYIKQDDSYCKKGDN